MIGELPRYILRRDCRFLLLCVASFASNFGSTTLLMSLSLKTFADTGSSFQAAAVYGSQWLLPILFLPVVGWAAGRYSVKWVLIDSQFLSIVTTLAAAAAYGKAQLAFFSLMALRGILENLSKSGSSVALKVYMPSSHLARASSYHDASRYVAAALASLFGLMILDRLSAIGVALVSSGAFGVAGICYLMMPAARPTNRSINRPSLRFWGATLAMLGRDPALASSFLRLAILTGLYQGYYYVARSTLPLGHLGMSIGAAALLQALVSLTFLGGALFVARLFQGRALLVRRLTTIRLTLLASSFMAASVATHLPLVGVPCFLLYLFWYEVIYTHSNNRLLVLCRADEIANISSAKNGALSFMMILAITLGGLLSDVVGFARATWILALLPPLSMMLLALRKPSTQS